MCISVPGGMEIITYIQEQITTNPILNTPPLGPPPSKDHTKLRANAPYSAESVRDLMWCLSENIAEVGKCSIWTYLLALNNCTDPFTFCIPKLSGGVITPTGIKLSNTPSFDAIPRGCDEIYVLSSSTSKIYYVNRFDIDSTKNALPFTKEGSYKALTSVIFPTDNLSDIPTISESERNAIFSNTGHIATLPIPDIRDDKLFVLAVLHLGLLQALHKDTPNVASKILPFLKDMQGKLIEGRGKLEKNIKLYILESAEENLTACRNLVETLPDYPFNLAKLKCELYTIIEAQTEKQARKQAEAHTATDNGLPLEAQDNVAPFNNELNNDSDSLEKARSERANALLDEISLNTRKTLGTRKFVRILMDRGYAVRYLPKDATDGTVINPKTLYVTITDKTLHYTVLDSKNKIQKGTIPLTEVFPSSSLALITQRFIDRSLDDILDSSIRASLNPKYQVRHLPNTTITLIKACTLRKMATDPTLLSVDDIVPLFNDESGLVLHNNDLYEINPNRSPIVTLIKKDEKDERLVKKVVALFADIGVDTSISADESAQKLFAAITGQIYVKTGTPYVQSSEDTFTYTVRTPEDKLVSHPIAFKDLPKQDILHELYEVHAKRATLTILEETTKRGYTPKRRALPSNDPRLVAEARYLAAEAEVDFVDSAAFKKAFADQLEACKQEAKALAEKNLILEMLQGALKTPATPNGSSFQTFRTDIVQQLQYNNNLTTNKLNIAFNISFNPNQIGDASLDSEDITYLILRTIARKDQSLLNYALGVDLMGGYLK